MLRIILAVGGIQMLAILIAVARSKIVALLIGPAGVGIVSVIDQVVQLIAYLAAFGLPTASIRFLSRAHSESPERFRSVYGAFLKAIAVMGSLGAVAGLVIVTVRPQWLGEELAEYRGVVAVAMLAVPGMLLGGYVPNVLASARRVRASAMMAAVSNTSVAVGCVAGILAGGLLGMYVGLVSAVLAVALGGLVYIRAVTGLPLFDPSAGVFREFNGQRKILYLAATHALGAVAMSSALLVIRQSVLSGQGPTAAGLLQSAYALSLAIGMVLNPTNGLYLTPIMNRNLEPAAKIGTALAYQSRLTAMLVLLGAPLVLAPKTCIYILFSSRFLEAADWVYLFVLAQMVFQLAGIYQAMLIGLDRLNAFAVATFGGHATAGVVAWLIVPTWGVEGAALALLAGASFSCAVSLFWLHRHYGFLRVLEPFAFVAYGLLAIPVAGYLALGFPEWEPVAFAVRILVGLLLLAGTILFMTRKDRRSLRDAILKRVRRRA